MQPHKRYLLESDADAHQQRWIGYKIYYFKSTLTTSTTANVYLLLHGMGESSVNWLRPEYVDYAVDDLQSALKHGGCDIFICVDRFGYGSSSNPSKYYSYSKFAEDINQLLEHLQVSDVTAVGHSSGGPCALALSLIDYNNNKKKKRMIKGIILIGSDAEYAHPLRPYNNELAFDDSFAVTWTKNYPFIPSMLIYYIQMYYLNMGMQATYEACQSQETRALDIVMRGLYNEEEYKEFWEENSYNRNIVRDSYKHSLVEINRDGHITKRMDGVWNDYYLERIKYDFEVTDMKEKDGEFGKVRVDIWCGTKDQFCSVNQGKFIQTILSQDGSYFDSHLHVLEDEGHFSMILREVTWRKILSESR